MNAPAADSLRLHCNENPYGPPPGVVQAAAAELEDRCAVYPDNGCTALRARIARHFRVAPESVAIGNGSEDLIMLTALTFLRPGDPVLVSEMSFPGYAMASTMVGAEVRAVSLDGYRISAPAICAALTEEIKLVFVCNPNNPTGTVLDRAEVDRIITAAEAAGVIPVFDEAYMEFAGPEYEYAVDAVRASRRLLVLRTFSKLWGLASLRVGYVLGPPDLIGRIEESRQTLPFGVNRIAQRAAIAALDHDGFVEEIRQRTVEARKRLCEGLELLGAEFVPSSANFVLVRTSSDSAAIAARLADEHGVLVRDLARFGLPGHLRVTVGTPEQVDRFCAALAAVMPAPSVSAGLGARSDLPVPTLAPVGPTELFNGYVGANAVFALNELGVWERLLDGAQPVASLAVATRAETTKLLALVRVAALLGYVELRSGTVALTVAGRDLVAQRGFFTWAVGGHSGLLRRLADVATGVARFGRDIGRDGEKVAEGSGLVGRTLTRPIEQQVLDGIEFESVADLGCGDGSRLIRMCRDGSRRGIGVEADEQACELATKSVAEAGLSDRITIVRDDARRLGDRRFPGVDLVTCFLMLHDLFAATDDPTGAVRKLREVFPDARRFLIADTAAVDWAGHEGPLPAFSLGFELLHAYMETSIVSAETYLHAFAGAGLRVERREQFGSPSTSLYLLACE